MAFDFNMLFIADKNPCSKFCTALLMLVIEVLTPLEASNAVSANPPVSVSHSIIASLNWSNVIVPFFNASYNSFALPLAIPSFLDTLVNAGAIVSCKVLHDSISTVPLASICEYCCKPRDASSELDPLAKNAWFNAIVVSVALSILLVTADNDLDVVTTSAKFVGKPCTDWFNFATLFWDCSIENPKDFITFG